MKRRKLTVWMLLVTMCGAFVLGGCSGRTGNEEEETAPQVTFAREEKDWYD